MDSILPLVIQLSVINTTGTQYYFDHSHTTKDQYQSVKPRRKEYLLSNHDSQVEECVALFIQCEVQIYIEAPEVHKQHHIVVKHGFEHLKLHTEGKHNINGSADWRCVSFACH